LRLADVIALKSYVDALPPKQRGCPRVSVAKFPEEAPRWRPRRRPPRLAKIARAELKLVSVDGLARAC